MSETVTSISLDDSRALIIVTGNIGPDTTYEVGTPNDQGSRDARRNGKEMHGKLMGVWVATVEEATRRQGGMLLATELRHGGYAIPSDINVGDRMVVAMDGDPHASWITRPVKSIEAV